MRNGKIVLIDDNEGILKSLRIILSREFTDILTSTTPNILPSLLRSNEVDVVVLDMNFTSGRNTGNEGLYWLSEIRSLCPGLPVVLITAYGEVELAVKALKQGATDFIVKPWDNQKLLATLTAAWELSQSRKEVKQLRHREQALSQELNRTFQPLIGESAAIKEVLRLTEKVAATDANVLITGENGTGKDLVAQAIHAASPRAGKGMLRVDLGSIAATLFESEMFGHVKGAFTDAKADRPGKFELADGGTLFLDEIGNLTLPLQAKLLSVLQNREVCRLGASTPVAVDIRLIAATNRDLLQAVKEGTFREDLLYRINTIHIPVPPLRKRGDDVLLLAEYFLKKFAPAYGKPLPHLSPRAREKLLSYSWPGNVRELQHCIERAVILSDSPTLTASDLPTGNERFSSSRPTTLEEMEKQFIAEALEAQKGNLTLCAQQLNISRQTLYNKMKKYNL